MQLHQIQNTITELYRDSENDYKRIIKGFAKSIFKPMRPADFKDAYLAISRAQGRELVQLIVKRNIKQIVEFGTSFGISTLFLAEGVAQTQGNIITTELIPSKAQKAIENFEHARVNHLIEVRVGDAMNTLKDYHESIDLLLLDGWKDLYLPLFQMLESNFHTNTIIYVDNADMSESKVLLNNVSHNSQYQIEYIHSGKAALISLNT